MTVIIASLFLPYTVHFELDSKTNADDIQSIKRIGEPISRVLTPVPVGVGHGSGGSGKPKSSTTSIIPSSRLSTPVIASGGDGSNINSSSNLGTESPSVEDFFYSRLSDLSSGSMGPSALSSHSAGAVLTAPGYGTTSATSATTAATNSGVSSSSSSITGGGGHAPQLVQPRSRVSNLKIQANVVDHKKYPFPSDKIGGTSVKINRSSTSLASLGSSNQRRLSRSLNGSVSNLALLNSTGMKQQQKTTRQPSREQLEFVTNNNHRALLEGLNEDDFDCQGRLAPFGGFSNPNIEDNLLNEENIFETCPWEIVSHAKGNGSLYKAAKIAQDGGILGDYAWVGTLAMPTDEVPDKIKKQIEQKLHEEYRSEPVFPDDATFDGHYHSFCKQILSPTLHYQIPDDPKSKAFEDHSWKFYKAMNQLVADRIVEVYERDNSSLAPEDPLNIIWIHDYHLMLVPAMIRKKLPHAKIGLFFHVSFPSSEVFRIFAQRNEMLKGMLGANSITFQTEEYVRHFFQTVSRLLLADINDAGVFYEGHLTLVNTTPVGIDVPQLQEEAHSPSVLEWRRAIKERWGGQKLIVTRDKVDKLRGIKQKFLAYERFLTDNPQYLEDTVFIQICLGEPTDPDYESECMQIAGRINAKSKNLSTIQPMVILQKEIEFDQYLALQAEADCFIVSSMREGLNLTCHEFITCAEEKKSPLILSEFTGSSSLLSCGRRGALMVNPWDIKKFSELFLYLLKMGTDEKAERWLNCFAVIDKHDSKVWVADCLKTINKAWNLYLLKSATDLQPLNKESFLKFYNVSNKREERVFFFNFETPASVMIVPETETSSYATVSGKTLEPKHLDTFLAKVLENPKNHVYIFSLLKKKDLETLYGRCLKVGLIAENGGYVKIIGSKLWTPITNEAHLQNWFPVVERLIESKVVRLPGSFMKVQDCTINFVTGAVENKERRNDALGDCIAHIQELHLESNDDGDNIHALLVRNTVIIQEHLLNVKAVEFILKHYKNSHKVFYCGGDTNIDETIYEYLNRIPGSMTAVVMRTKSHSKSIARYNISGTNAMLKVLASTPLS
ncbi:uncharacterized protein KQ657_005127 [Scheffersomyces spartinae]|uniref:Uncharacterized protein n=1 Tax=Scheffersomyces spartinae TaxID=45513 RepID=A0A9P7V9N1_9ASCO|nr:uncharacterized protein KQ657_005127 [Scheffersomyces spartinae]KAG7193928.1 hypothetical protein KQ657_005127 [Scheffersomyces spartinae]